MSIMVTAQRLVLYFRYRYRTINALLLGVASSVLSICTPRFSNLSKHQGPGLLNERVLCNESLPSSLIVSFTLGKNMALL